MSSDKELPSVEFARILNVVAFCASAVGADVANPKFRVNILTLGVWLCIISYFIFTFHYAFQAGKEDWKNLLQVFCMAPGAFQGAVKLAVGIYYTKYLSIIGTNLPKLYVHWEKRSFDYSGILRKSCDRQRKIIKVFVFLYAGTALSLMAVPVVMFFLRGERHLIMSFLIPGVNVETSIGYYITLAMHATCVTCGAFGLFAGDLYMLIFSEQSHLFVNIFALKVKSFNDIILTRDPNNYLDELYTLIKWHQFYTEYNKTINKVFSLIVTACVGTSSFGIICCMFIIIAGNWPGVYTYFVLSTCGLYVYCILGTQLEKCDDKFYKVLCDISWYELSTPMQKMIIQVLYKAQHPSQMMVAGIMPLSVNTALRITKTLYSILMMMLQFVEAEA